MSTNDPRLLRMDNEPRDYAWGIPGGISRLLGRPETTRPEAELWLGAHPGSPSRILGDSRWSDVAEWEADHDPLPFLMKLLAAEAPLSLQAHPSAEQARAGYRRENELGIPLDSPDRNYKDPHAKPELIVAISDDFEALCGFRPVEQTRQVLAGIAAAWPSVAPDVHALSARLTGDLGLRETFRRLLQDDDDVRRLTSGLCDAAASDPTRFPLLTRLASHHPGDPGVAAALLLNHVELASGECLWLPAGNIHAYLHGIGVELMGPSDNVLRGGLTAKHVDADQLLDVLDFTTGEPERLGRIPLGAHAQAYRPAQHPSGKGTPFQLIHVDGDARLEVSAGSIIAIVSGAFDLDAGDRSHTVAPGDFFLVSTSGPVTITGRGGAFIATTEAIDA
ncbi:MAG TPA: mannose-6-phosphate isomerase, class I [Microbacterium sp.]|uniref:mannose-6-phosphate isomerase, class I n=1 Tax=Microbacterium sp. TaxID=51671 RepID=UPI002B4A01C9|nr:mannose-6-phosphate isomerase, class I [Microbacterium sp.]HKT57105.1 mannose-6-phosphate isomerase, class I [Microbacterium sp.]